MNKTKAVFKASFLLLRIYLFIVLGIVSINLIVTLIVSLAMGSNSDNSHISISNSLTIFLVFISIVLPVSLFKRIINLGATRKEYYTGLLVIYTIWAALFALFNILWRQLELSFIPDTVKLYNILEVFHWDQFSVLGMFIYQFGTYMLLISILNLLFSGLQHVVGWIIWVFLIAAIPIGTSIASFRHEVAYGLTKLLFNDSLLQGFALTFPVSCLFLVAGWFFIRRRSFQ